MREAVAMGPALAGDEPALRRILRETPFPGPVSLSFEREPDWWHAAATEGDRHQVFVGRRGGRVVGFGARAVREVWVDGAPSRAGYLGQLRALPGERGTLAALREGYRLAEAARAPDELPFDFTAIVGDNPRARRLLGSGRAGLPTYRPLGELVTLAFAPRPSRRPPAIPCAPGGLAEVAAFLDGEARRFQLAPRLDAARLGCPVRARGLAPGDFLRVEEGGALAAAGALWDQRAFKQAVVRGHSRAVRLVRPALRLLGRRGAAAIPAVGETLAAGWLAFAFAREDAPGPFRRLLEAALDLAHRRGLTALLLGLAADHPLLAEATRLRPRAYRSTLFAVHRAGAAARLDALDGRPLAPEVALL